MFLVEDLFSLAVVEWSPSRLLVDLVGFVLSVVRSSIGAGVGDNVLFGIGTEDICGILSGIGSLEVDIV